MDEKLDGKVLVIINDEQESQELFPYLTNWGLEAVECNNHLQALTYMEDNKFDLVLVCSNYEDIDGLEFCRLVRRREKEKNAQVDYTYLILIGNEEERLNIIETEFWDVDDFVIRPFLFGELRWRIGSGIKKLQSYKEMSKNLQVVCGQDVLNEDGLYSCITSELNRSWRKSGQICLLLVRLKGLELAALNYGEEWMYWLDNYLLGTMNKYLRDYDRVGRVDKGVWCLVIPDSSRDGLQGLINRLKTDMQELLESRQISQLSNMDIVFHGILLNLELPSYKKSFAFDQLWEWLIEKATNQEIQEEIITATLNESGLWLNSQEDGP